MTTEQDLINEIQLLHANKSDLIEAMREVGIDVTADTPLRVIAERMKEAGGQCCITKIATVEETGTGEYRHRFFTVEEWQEMDMSLRNNYPRIGVLLIAEGHRLSGAKEPVTRSDDDASTTMPWSSTNADISGLTNYGDNTYGMITDFDSKGNTEKILAHAASFGDTVLVAPLRAHQYRGSLNDPTYWCLPAMGHALLIAKYINEINEVLNVIGGIPIQGVEHWTSTEREQTGAYTINMATAVISGATYYKTHNKSARSVAEV